MTARADQGPGCAYFALGANGAVGIFAQETNAPSRNRDTCRAIPGRRGLDPEPANHGAPIPRPGGAGGRQSAGLGRLPLFQSALMDRTPDPRL
jgi:hypothetical protein